MMQYLNTFLTYNAKVSKVALEVVPTDTSAYRFKLATFTSRRAVVQYRVPNLIKKKENTAGGYEHQIPWGIKWKLIDSRCEQDLLNAPFPTHLN